MRKLVFLILLTVAFVFTHAQVTVPIGSWRTHLPYNSVNQVVETPSFVYVVAEVGFYGFHKASGEIELYSRVNGFSETVVKTLAYSEEYNTLVIAYKNTNIDLLKNGKIINIPGILRKTIIGVKEINEISIIGKMAYLSCSFGVVVIDIEKEEVFDNYMGLNAGTNMEVYSLSSFGDSIYIGTPKGLLAAYDDKLTLADFNYWKLSRTDTDGISLLRSYSNQLYFVQDSILYAYNGFTYTPAENGQVLNYRSININHNRMVVCKEEGITIYAGNSLYRQSDEKFKSSAVLDHQDNIWTGGFYTGLIKIDPNGSFSSLKPQGPFGPTSYDMKANGERLWVSSGGHSTTYGPTFTNSGYYMFEKGKWSNRPLNIPDLASMYDFTAIEINPKTDEVWMGTHGTGLARLKSGNFVERFDESNSIIQSGPSDFTLILGLALDSKDNLWMSNYEASPALLVRYKDGSWGSFDIGEKKLGEMVVDLYDNIWILIERDNTQGIMVFHRDEESGLIEKRILTTTKEKGNLPNNIVNTLAVDKDGEIWVGTETGLAIFYNPFLIFEGGTNADAQQIIIDDGNDVGYLLGNEVINDISIDGANRKWVATNNGAWLIKADGSEVLMHFTKENSPLLENTIICVGINPISGEVFFGTPNGIISYRGDATEAGDFHENTLVYPNPVHSDYEGAITITGLPQNATVKIADVAGRVVYEMIATGGTAVWDGRNFRGERPQTGVYLIFSSNEDDEDALVSKLLIVR